MSVAVVATVKGKGNSTGVTTGNFSPNDTTGATVIITAAAHDNSSASPVVTDSKVNVYTNLTKYGASGGTAIRLSYKENPAVGVNHTITIAQLTSYPSVIAYAFSGTDVFDPGKENGSANASVSSIQSGAITPSVDGALVVCGIGVGDPTGIAIDGGFSTPEIQVGEGGVAWGTAFSWLVQGGAAGANPTWSSFGSSTPAAAAIAAFKPAAGGGGGTSIVPIVGNQYRRRWAA